MENIKLKFLKLKKKNQVKLNLLNLKKLSGSIVDLFKMLKTQNYFK